MEVGAEFLFSFSGSFHCFLRTLLLVIPGKGRGVCLFPRMDGFGCFALLASRENTNLGGLERERGSCTIS